jgi:hypothetical protein
MIEFDRYFLNIFDDKNITASRLAAFTRDHIAKLRASNPGGVYDSIIAATESLLGTFGTEGIEKGSDRGELKGGVTAKKEARTMAMNYVAQKEGLVKSTFGKKSSEYKEFFPRRLNLIRKATQTDFELLLGVLVSKAQKYEAELGSNFRIELTALRDNYKDALARTGQATGGLSAIKRAQYQTKIELQTQLCRNLCTVALNNIGKPEIAKNYFNRHLLFPAKRHHLFKAKIEAGEKREVCTFTYAETKRLNIMNTGAMPLSFQMTLKGVKVGRAVTLKVAEKLNEPFSFFSSAGDALMVTNDSEAVGRYMVWEIA